MLCCVRHEFTALYGAHNHNQRTRMGHLNILVKRITCAFQQCGILTSVDLDEPIQPPVKLRSSKLMEYSSD